MEITPEMLGKGITQGGKMNFKRWLKKHWKWVVVGVGVLFIANGSWGITMATEEWVVAIHTVAIVIWLGIILMVSGALAKIFEWWEKD